MRKTLAGIGLGAALVFGPVAHAAAQTVPTIDRDIDVDDDDDGDAGLWGLAGLAGLLGLAGLAGRKRREVVERPGTTYRSPPTTGGASSTNP